MGIIGEASKVLGRRSRRRCLGPSRWNPWVSSRLLVFPCRAGFGLLRAEQVVHIDEANPSEPNNERAFLAKFWETQLNFTYPLILYRVCDVVTCDM
jgi:hypothetical protein